MPERKLGRLDSIEEIISGTVSEILNKLADYLFSKSNCFPVFSMV
jgi:hypothetical protein